MTHYETLQVCETASPHMIRAAFTLLQQIYHPDKDTGDLQMSQKVGEAYAVLKNPEAREAYDRQLAQERSAHRRVVDIGGINADAYPAAYIFDGDVDFSEIAREAALAAGGVFVNSILAGMNPAARQLFEQALARHRKKGAA